MSGEKSRLPCNVHKEHLSFTVYNVVGHSSEEYFEILGKFVLEFVSRKTENLTENWLEIGSVCKMHRCKSKSVRVNLCVYTRVYTCTSCLSVVSKLEFRFNCVTCNGKNVKEYKIVIRLQ